LEGGYCKSEAAFAPLLLKVELEFCPGVEAEAVEGSFGTTKETTTIPQKSKKPQRYMPQAIFFWLLSVLS